MPTLQSTRGAPTPPSLTPWLLLDKCLNPTPSTSLFPDRQMKWHEACLSISAAILEILNAWENGVLTFESIQVSLVGG